MITSRLWRRRSLCFAGHVAEGATLAGMLQGLGAPPAARIVMDCGLASEVKLAWLRAEGYRYLVVSRERERPFDPQAAMWTASVWAVSPIP